MVGVVKNFVEKNSWNYFHCVRCSANSYFFDREHEIWQKLTEINCMEKTIFDNSIRALINNSVVELPKLHSSFFLIWKLRHDPLYRHDYNKHIGYVTLMRSLVDWWHFLSRLYILQYAWSSRLKWLRKAAIKMADQKYQKQLNSFIQNKTPVSQLEL